MSRGLGKMQRLILASLKPAKQAHVEGKFNYSGAARFAKVRSQGALFAFKLRANGLACFHELVEQVQTEGPERNIRL